MTNTTINVSGIFLPNLVIGRYILEKMIGTPSQVEDTSERLAGKKVNHINQHATEKFNKHEIIMNAFKARPEDGK